jgi:hypothetical protein
VLFHLHNLVLQLLLLLLRSEETELLEAFAEVPDKITKQQGPHLLILRTGDTHFLVNLLEVELHLFDLQAKLLDLRLERVLGFSGPTRSRACLWATLRSLRPLPARSLRCLWWGLERDSSWLLKRGATIAAEVCTILDLRPTIGAEHRQPPVDQILFSICIVV